MPTEKILVIEDDQDIARLLALYLESEGYEVILTHRGRNGLELAGAQQPHIILLDIGLPDMSGWEVCSRLRSFTDIPIIFLTGQTEIDSTVLALEIGANDYIVKPFDGKILAARIRAHLRQTPHLETVTVSGMITTKPIFGSPPSETEYQSDIFVLMPFAKEMLFIYESYIAPIGENLGLTVKRGDNEHFFSNDTIIREIWGAIYASRLIIADCTGRNPNVFYELGIAHTLGKKTIMITQDNVPFDVQQWRYIHYENTPNGMRHFERNLTKAIKTMLKL